MITNRQAVAIGGAVVFALGTLYTIPNMMENLDASQVMVIQSPWSGDLAVFTDPGVKPQWFGTVTKYPRRATYAFGQEGKDDLSKRIQFNDGGHASVYGSVQWEMPLAPKDIVAIHKAFGSAEGVQSAAVSKMIDSALYLAGPLMSSIESTAERRAELLQYINDQAEKGVYVTRVVEKEITDPITGVKREVAASEIVRDEKGVPRRQQGSILSDFNIHLLPLSISQIKYDQVVEQQIAERQKATNQVQIAQANADRKSVM